MKVFSLVETIPWGDPGDLPEVLHVFQNEELVNAAKLYYENRFPCYHYKVVSYEVETTFIPKV
jgi:hypothetical protein